MRLSIALLAVAVSLPITVLSQATTSAPAAVPSAIVPFSTLPSCALLCGPLFDAQGACSPPVQAVSTSCFCQYASLQPFYQSTLNVCNNACPNDPSGLLNIQKWFVSLCASTTTSSSSSAPTGTSTETTTAGATSTGSSGLTKGDNTWFSTHWQWVVMVIVLVVAITGMWIGACLLRRRYIRKRDLNYEMRPPTAPWVGGQSNTHTPYGDGVTDLGLGGKSRGVDMSPAEARMMAKNEKKKWVVKERT